MMKATKIVFSLILIFFLISFLFYKSYSSIFVRSIFANQPEEQKHLQGNEVLVSFLPLEQGEATLVQLANGKTYLIDTGNKNSSEQLLKLLHDHKVVQIKAILLTNACDDHVGGFLDVLQEFHVEQIYLPELIASSFSIPTSYQTKIKYLKKDDIEQWSQVKVTVLAPEEPLSLSPQDNSLVFQLTHQDIYFLFTSDIGDEIEKRVMKQYPLKSEILKVSDFGNNTASSLEFLEKVDPQVGIIFSSDQDLYQASQDVIDRLNETWTEVYELSKVGEVQITSNGKDYQIEVIKGD
ncbi:beta-lactamase superfamily II metal-dependent hydrolase [Tepidibacillus fermentans]|uniref:Beta-lactamase superfamily II metal-dependent hydrolase n=2 Tax=Tepidibacillus fermentans TaxID=1281767 RepID=A0A4R3KLD5_9BACI|nr:beta-lactamase superfamily II metal-dependent hydrolase [Tepidibacillus fermentans]